MCSGPPTIYQTSPLMSKHGNWVPLLMILAANTSVDRKSLGSSAHCHKKVSSRRLYGSRRCFLANWYPQEEHCSIWCNPVQRSWLQKTQFLHCDHVIVLYFRFKHVFFPPMFQKIFECTAWLFQYKHFNSINDPYMKRPWWWLWTAGQLRTISQKAMLLYLYPPTSAIFPESTLEQGVSCFTEHPVPSPTLLL